MTEHLKIENATVPGNLTVDEARRLSESAPRFAKDKWVSISAINVMSDGSAQIYLCVDGVWFRIYSA